MNKSDEALSGLRHSFAHLLTAAVKQLWPGAQNAIGPSIETGFYQDFDMAEHKISEDDLPKIEQKMREILKGWGPFVVREVSAEQAKKDFADNPYKVELIEDFAKEGKKITENDPGGFLDLCKGGHAKDPQKEMQHFKLLSLAGAYWRGDSKNKMLTRIYGTAFASKQELDDHVHMLEEAKKRDHRKLGQELDLFVFSDLIGAGLPLFTPRGTVLRRKLDELVQELRDEYDYQEVNIPHITKKEAYIASGHWKKFEHELFRIKTREGHEFAMKPMNCPHHTQIYAAKVRSYRELPVRYRETTTCYRDEQTGELNGLTRVRAFTQDDAHVFCRTQQIEEETLKIWDIVDRFYGVFGFELKVRLSTHDPVNMEAYSGSEDKWRSSEEQLLKLVKEKVGDNYLDGVGEAAFYGPKIDFMAKDAIGREHQVATIQLDFNQPEGFDLTCVNEEGQNERIVMIHAAIMGSIDRFLSVYIEHTAGRFPIWLAPEQIRLATLNQDKSIVDFAQNLAQQAKELGLRVSVDSSNESVGKKIREAEVMKVPYTVVIGQKELESKELSPRIRQDLAVSDEHPSRTAQELLKTIANEAKMRVNKTSL